MITKSSSADVNLKNENVGPAEREFIDESRIQSYLDLSSPSEIAKIAATLTGSDIKSSVQDAVEKAIELRLSVGTELRKIRQRMLRSMNPATLKSLAIRQCINPDECPLQRDAYLADPDLASWIDTKGTSPAAQAISEYLQRNQEDIEVQAACEQLDLLPPPPKPWTLDRILQYCSRETVFDLSLLRKAFRDYLAVDHKREDDHSLFLRKGNALQHLEKQYLLSFDAKTQKVITAEIIHLRSIILTLEKKTELRKSFSPENEIDPIFNQDAQYFEQFKEHENQLPAELVIVILNPRFLQFLKDHRSSYESLHRSQEEASQQRSRQRKQAARVGRENRELNRWRKLVINYIDYHRSKHHSPSLRIIPEEIREFASDGKSKPGAKVATHLLGTILNAAWAGEGAPQTLARLRERGSHGEPIPFKTLDDRGVDSLLRVAASAWKTA